MPVIPPARAWRGVCLPHAQGILLLKRSNSKILVTSANYEKKTWSAGPDCVKEATSMMGLACCRITRTKISTIVRVELSVGAAFQFASSFRRRATLLVVRSLVWYRMRRQPRRYVAPRDIFSPQTRADSRSHQNIRDDDEPCRECAPKASAVPEFSRPNTTCDFLVSPSSGFSGPDLFRICWEFPPCRCRAAPRPGGFRRSLHRSFPWLRRSKRHKPTLSANVPCV